MDSKWIKERDNPYLAFENIVYFANNIGMCDEIEEKKQHYWVKPLKKVESIVFYESRCEMKAMEIYLRKCMRVFQSLVCDKHKWKYTSNQLHHSCTVECLLLLLGNFSFEMY